MVLNNNQKEVEKYKNGETGLIGYLLAKVVKVINYDASKLLNILTQLLK